MKRADGRQHDQLREVQFETDYIIYPEGSVLVSMGNTKVLCNVSVEDGVPRWMADQERPRGWITGEYAMLPRSTHSRTNRETLRPRGRTQEIKRLIGRALRAAVDLEKLGARTCTVDCDVLQADGGTRTASVTGGYVALALAINKLSAQGLVPADIFKAPVAAISVGILDNTPLLDLCYEEDVAAEVDANFVMNAKGELIEVQGTAEGEPFAKEQLLAMLELAHRGIERLVEKQTQVLGDSI
ncbi:ribonuclease PH [Oligoflexia bacterium]|nr:ribonuclease PH [Oligoflexia bacterium]